MRTLEKKNIDLVKSGMRSSAKLVRAQAKEDAPVLTGAYKRAIKHSVRSSRRAGWVIAKVGIPRGSDVMKYAGRVESKYSIFSRLEKTQHKAVNNEVRRGIIKAINKIRIT
jgi:hypothetical protein